LDEFEGKGVLFVEAHEAFFVEVIDGAFAEHGCHAEEEGAGEREDLEGDG
jgi:hypothetical protein